MRRHSDGHTGPGSTFDEKDGWSSSGTLTTRSSGQPITVQAKFPVAAVYTVQFAVTPPASGVFRAVATIVWTVEGNQISRQIDIGNGVSISAPSQAVRIIVNDLTTAPLGGAAGESYGVTVSITRGVRPASNRPPTLSGEGAIIPAPPATPPPPSVLPIALAPNQTATYFIPQTAGVVSVAISAVVIFLPAAPDIGAFVVIAQGNPSANTKTYRYEDQGAGDSFIVITPFATEVTLTNFDPTNNVIVSLVWGIDG
jgi:hypothetical protein